ncbi:MAG: PEP-CTERM sorting domain-containing protein [Vicinamibacterales bacterium]
MTRVSVKVKQAWIRRTVALLFLAFIGAVPASASTLDFAGLGCQAQFAAFGGYAFSDGWVTECDSDYLAASPGWNNTTGAPSGEIAAGNTYASSGIVTITRAQPFTFVSAKASSFLTSDAFDFTTPLSSANLLIQGYLNNAFVGSVAIDFSVLSPGYTDIGPLAGAVDELRFFSASDQDPSSFAGPDYWLIDDLVLEDANVVTPVPEPSALVLVGPGLGMLSVMRRSRRRSRHDDLGV